jgi:hypothetical protein
MKTIAFDRVEVTDEPIIGNAGLATIGELMCIAGIEQVRSGHNQSNYKIKDTDIIKVFCGMVATGRVGFEHIHYFEGDGFFSASLGIKRMQGEASLRQRFEAMSKDRRVHEDLAACSIRMLKKVKQPLVKIDVPGFRGVRVDTDSSIFDNGQSKKKRHRCRLFRGSGVCAALFFYGRRPGGGCKVVSRRSASVA